MCSYYSALVLYYLFMQLCLTLKLTAHAHVKNCHI